MPKNPIRYNVAPRYTAGSPAQVDQKTALRVARQETQAILGYLEGIYGEEAQQKAQRLGLEWIVYSLTETSRVLIYFDIITGVMLTKPLPKQGHVFNFIPLYNSTAPNFTGVMSKMKYAKIRTEEWIQRNADNQRTLLCVPLEDLRTAQQLVEWMDLTPMPEVHKERRIA